ncbi:hypothetical protein [Pseudomonas sp. NPDC089569]|uniref:hypothetical protein n=1 Tax=Pseudomonas sp. NPDC089569 TaxID=3390722 RepID=UPI003D0689AA
MKLAAKFFAIEAVIFFLPAFLVLLLALASVPEIVLATLEGSASAAKTIPLLAVIIAGIYALWVLVRLVIASIKGRTFEFGVAFWLAVILGTIVAAYLWFIADTWPLVVFFVVPLFVVCLHAAIVQSRTPTN